MRTGSDINLNPIRLVIAIPSVAFGASSGPSPETMPTAVSRSGMRAAQASA